MEINEEQKFLFLVRGIPGSGRGMVAARLAYPDMPVISADDFFLKDGQYNFDGSKLKEAHSWCQQQVEEYMQSNTEKIFVSNTFVEDWELTPYYILAKQYRYHVHCLIVENRHRGTTDKIPEYSTKRMRDKFSVHI